MKQHSPALLFAIVIALFTVPSFAAHPLIAKDGGVFLPKERGLKDGPYIGVQAGYDGYIVKDNFFVADDDIDTFSMSPSLSATGWVGGLFVGYGHYFQNNLYLGAEVFGNTTKANTSYVFTAMSKSDLDTDMYDVKFHINSSYGINLLPGIKVTPTFLLYARLGWNWVNVQAQQILTSDAGGGFPDNEITTAFNKSERMNGFSYGIGLETLIVEQFSLRSEYTHTNYASFSSYSFFTLPFGAKFTASDNQFMLGLVYHVA